jgi:cytochrome P450
MPTGLAVTTRGAVRNGAEARRLFLRMARPSPEADPYPLYARLREIGVVVPVHFPGVTPRYLVTTFAGCAAMLRDDAVGPLTEDHFHESNPTWKEQDFVRRVFGSMAFRSGAEHRLDRGMVAKYFTPTRIERRRAEITELAETLLDRLADLGAACEPVDIERELALPYSALVIGRLMGICDERAVRLGWLARKASSALELAPSPPQRQQATEAGEQILAELTALIDERRRHPADDMVTDLIIRCGPDQERLISFLTLLFGAGFDSPTSLIGMGLSLFMDNPEQARLLREDPGLADTATEEILRYEPAVQVMFRAAKRETTLGGVTIAAGSILLGLVAGALRDPSLVSDPDRFDIRRSPSSGLSFGGGAHYCIGAHLARLSGSILFPRLLRRFPLMRPAGRPTYRAPGAALRGFESLPVTLTSRTDRDQGRAPNHG